MLTRLKINGFKNLVDVDIQFGAFTCIAGANGVGKSNLFDAIRFISALATNSLRDAALSVRDKRGRRPSDLRAIFNKMGNESAQTLSFEAEMIIPTEAVDDLGQVANATTTFVRYAVELGYREDESQPTLSSLVLLKEELTHIKIRDAARRLQFDHSVKNWRKSAVTGRRTVPFISTDEQDGQRFITLRQDGHQGRPKQFLAASLPRTVLSTVSAAESPTALIVRRELESWTLLQLDPAALREPDTFITPPGLQPNGSHLPATIDYLNRQQGIDKVALRLRELLEDVEQIQIDRDARRELISLEVVEKDGTIYPAHALSDGALRFLALSILDMDHSIGLICLEEPENGIHPARIPALLQLLQEIAVDVTAPVSNENPLRQVIINTHSPAVVRQVHDDELLVAELVEADVDGKPRKQVQFNGLSDTWRSEQAQSAVSREQLFYYLNPIFGQQLVAQGRVMDRPDLKQLMMPLDSENPPTTYSTDPQDDQ